MTDQPIGSSNTERVDNIGRGALSSLSSSNAPTDNHIKENTTPSQESSETISENSSSLEQMVVALRSEIGTVKIRQEDLDDDDDCYVFVNQSLIDHSWSRKILELVGNKAKLRESFSWLSTVGGGFSALGERDTQFSMRAGSLSLGQQLKLAQQLGDERLEVMCHLFAALAALQLHNSLFVSNYINRVIRPLIRSLPYRDPIINNMLRHIFFRLSILYKCNNAIEARKVRSKNKVQDLDVDYTGQP